MYLLVLRLTGIALILAGLWCGRLMLKSPPEPPRFEDVLDSLPDHDFCAEARHLAARGEYAEAKALCEDIASCGLPGKKAAAILRGICDDRMNSFGFRARRTVTAFVTGDPKNSVEEAASAMLSDMLMYGDIRDLALQGYYKATGQETDPLIAALAAAGLATEFVDAADWAPALLKALRRTAAISDKLAAALLRTARRSGRMAAALRRIGSEITDLFRRSGFVRTKNILRTLDTAEDVSRDVKLARKSAPATHLLARAAKKDMPAAAKKLAAKNVSATYLLRVARKGPAGVTLLLRGVKSVRKGNAGNFLSRAAEQAVRTWGYKALCLPAAMIVAGLVLNAGALFRWLRARRSGKKSPPAC